MSFLSQSEKYDAQAAAEIIVDMQKELDDETSLKDTLDTSVEDKISSAKEFLEENAGLVDAQLEKIKELDKNIREAVVFNMKLQEEDKEYNDLITSDDYLDIANKIAEFNIIATKLADFLVEKGRRGRVSLL